MTRPPRRMLLLACAFAFPLAAQAQETGLTLSRVMLSSGGVGYVEYRGKAGGGTALGLDVPLDQVDDVLKSLVVFDSAGGVGGFTLPGMDGARAAFGDVPFGPDALTSPLAFLNSLRGVEVEVRGPRPMTGRLLRAERMPEATATPGGTGGAVDRTRVTLLTGEGMQQFVLEQAESVQVADPELRQRITRALDSMRRDAAQTTRHITLRMPGEGSRDIGVGYVVAAPLWKVSYRLVLPAAGADKARLQGWAVLENTTGADWNGVELALQYGNPVTFRQALYRTYFVPRPEVPVEILGRLLPGVDTRATARAEAAPAPPPSPVPAASMMASSAPRGLVGGAAAERLRQAPVMAAPAETTEATEGAQETVFVLPTPVVLAAGHTASMPILDRTASARRIFLLGHGKTHPLAAVRLVNDTPTSLPAGVLTLYDPASPAMFAGDARLGALPAGESRLLSFAEDLRTTAMWKSEEATTIAAITAADGVLRLDERLRFTSEVTLTAPAGEARDLLVEIAKRPGTTLVPDAAMPSTEETATAWRFAVTLAAGEKRVVTVRADRIIRQSIALANDSAMVVRLLNTPDLAPATKAALQKLADLRAAQTAREAELARIESQFGEIERDQERIRRNLGAVPSTDALHGRLIRQLDAQETRLATLRRNAEQARTAVEQAERALATAIGQFKL